MPGKSKIFFDELMHNRAIKLFSKGEKMKRNSTILFVLVILMAALMISGCRFPTAAAGNSTPPTAEPTAGQPNADLVATLVAQQVAEIMAAEEPTEAAMATPMALLPTELPTVPTTTAIPPTEASVPATQVSNWGWAEEFVVGEGGAWTAHQGFQSCIDDPLCWEITPDTQFKLVQNNSTIDCDAGNSVLVAAWDGDYSWVGGSLHIEGEDEVGQFVLFICPEDANLGIKARINASFALVTDLPSPQVLQGYLDQNVETMFGPDNCDGDGCDLAVKLTIVDTVTGENWTGRVEEPYGSWIVIK